MSNKKLNDRQKQVLKVVIDKHSTENKTISSLSLSKTANLKRWSSATIRNDMALLEEQGYLKKEYFSSGKIPTKQGYMLYIRDLMDEYHGQENIKEKLVKVFAERNLNIDKVMDECASLISTFLNLPIVLVKVQKTGQEKLKKIDLISINEICWMVYLITSSGEVIKDFVYIDKPDQRKNEDLLASIRLLNEKLYDCPLNQISEKLEESILTLKENVTFFEFIYEVLISKIILGKLVGTDEQQSNRTIYNTKALTEYEDINSTLILDLLDKYSTFSSVNYNYLKTGKTLFNLEGETDKGFAVATTDIDLETTTHKLSVVGPLRMNYSLIKYLLEFLNEKIQKLAKE